MQHSVSVIIPVYNRKQPLLKAIDSVLQQTCMPAEIIIVDDCSPFYVQEYLLENKYLTDGKIKVLRNEINLGPSGSRNKGIAFAAGELIAFLDSDDFWDKTKLEKQLLVWNRNPGLDLVYCASRWISETRDIKPISQTLYRDNIWEILVQGKWVPHITSTALMKKTALQKLNGFDPDLWHGEDLDLWMRLALENMQVDFCPECLAYLYFDSNERLTKHKDKLIRANAFLDKWVDYFYRKGEIRTGDDFRKNTVIKFAIESFVDGFRDKEFLICLNMYLKYLWNKKQFYSLIRSKLKK